MIGNFQKAKGIIPNCFGSYEYDKNKGKCFKCKYIRECCTETNVRIMQLQQMKEKKEEQICGEPACYGFYKSEEKCSKCKSREYCESATEEERIREEELDDFV